MRLSSTPVPIKTMDVRSSKRCTGEGVSGEVAGPKRAALVVDDDAGIRILVTRILARDFTVDSARDGAEAIEKMLQRDYTVIVLDLMMPRIDGFAVIRYLMEHDPERLRRVIVMTAFGATAFDRVCPPVERFIEKPFEIADLLNEARGCVDTVS